MYNCSVSLLRKINWWWWCIGPVNYNRPKTTSQCIYFSLDLYLRKRGYTTSYDLLYSFIPSAEQIFIKYLIATVTVIDAPWLSMPQFSLKEFYSSKLVAITNDTPLTALPTNFGRKCQM